MLDRSTPSPWPGYRTTWTGRPGPFTRETFFPGDRSAILDPVAVVRAPWTWWPGAWTVGPGPGRLVALYFTDDRADALGTADAILADLASAAGLAA